MSAQDHHRRLAGDGCVRKVRSLGMNPLHLLLVVHRGNATLTFRVSQRLIIVAQLDVARLEAFHVALLRLRLRADEAAHRQRRGGGRVASLGIRTGDELCLSAEPDLARHLVPRSFPKVKPARARVAWRVYQSISWLLEEVNG
jgi:hypothetical protein